MKKTIKMTAVIFLSIIILIQLILYGRNHNDPQGNETMMQLDSTAQNLFLRACGDCHSNSTHWPWYSNIAPVSWLVQYDVNQGRNHFNLNTSAAEEELLREIEEQINSDKMPPGLYTMMHSSARLSNEEKNRLLLGLQNFFSAPKSSPVKTNEDIYEDD